MDCSKSFILVFSCMFIVFTYALDGELHVINSDLGIVRYDTSNSLYFVNKVKEGNIPSHTATRVKRRAVADQIQGFTATRECDGILLKWNKLYLPFSPNRTVQTVNPQFKRINIYRSTAYFDDVSGMTPNATLQKLGINSYKDLYPPANVELYYAVTIVDGEEQEGKSVKAEKVVFVNAVAATGKLFNLIPKDPSYRGKVLHHSTAWDSKRNQYLVVFDLDVDNDEVPDQLYALMADTSGRLEDKVLNVTTHIERVAGNQGWPTVVYNSKHDEYMILFQLRAKQYFNNKYVIISQRIMGTEAVRVTAPAILLRATNSGGSNDWIDIVNPVLKFNKVTGGYVAAAVMKMDASKRVVDAFLDSKGKILKAEVLFSFNKSAYGPNIFFDSKRSEFYFTCTLENGGLEHPDVKTGYQMIILTKLDSNGAQPSNTRTTKTAINLIGYTNNTSANTAGYYNEHTDRLVLFWEDRDRRKPFIKTASVLVNGEIFVRDVKQYSCLSTEQATRPAAVYFPVNGSHFLVWQEQHAGHSVIGGELLQGLRSDKEQKNPVAVYNSILKEAFVTWQEDGKVLSRHITMDTQPKCTPSCTHDQTCKVKDTCVSRTGDSCKIKNGGCSHTCKPLGNWKLECSCPDLRQIAGDGKTCQYVPPCHGFTPVLKVNLDDSDYCPEVSCPLNSYCHVSNKYPKGKCCPAPLESYSVLVATTSSIWTFFVETERNRITFQKLQIHHSESLVALDYNSIDKRLYWSDAKAGKIKCLSQSKGEEILFWRDVGVVDGLTVDAEGGFLYWTDVTYQRIERANVDGTNRKRILEGLDKPRALVLYKNGSLSWIYWSDWGVTPKIERSDLDGGNRTVIVQGDLKWPNGLVIDEGSQRLFWADGGLDKIETSDLLGGERRKLLSSPHVHHPFSLVILKNRLFWSDWETGGIHSVDKETGKDVETVAQGLERPSGFVVFTGKPPVYSSARCPDPGHPKKGYRVPFPENDDYYLQDDKIHYLCYKNFILFGNITRKCLDDGSWSVKAPECLLAPIFRTTPSNTSVEELEIVTLRCSASSLDTKITWLKDGKNITGENFVSTTAGLQIDPVYESDEGLYVCKATNRAGSKEAHAYLEVRRTFKTDHTCGKVTLTTDARVVNGTSAESEAHPWQVSLWNTKYKNNFCGGSLVSKRWVVTAAHCFDKQTDKNIMVRLGKLYINKDEPDREQKIRPESIIRHPHYSKVTMDSDLALIRLREDANMNTSYITPICLPLGKKDADDILLKPGNNGVVTGWGSLSELKNPKNPRPDEFPDIMQKVTLPVVNQTVCKKANKDTKHVVTSNMFCAGSAKGGRDACTGDSGGPLAIENSPTGNEHNRRWVLAGVVSWGIGCGREGKYGVYTRISAFSRWINDHINDDR